MRITDTIARSGRSLRNAKGRTILTALAIAVGGFTLNATLAAGNGIRQYTNRLITSNFDSAELIVGRDKEIVNTGTPSSEPKEYDQNTTAFNFGGGGGGGGSLAITQVTDSDITKLKSYDFVEKVREEYQISPQYLTREGQKKYVPSILVYNSSQRPEIVAGSLPASGSDLTQGEVLIPDSYLAVLGFAEPGDAIGKNVLINFQQAFSINTATALLEQIKSGNSNLDANLLLQYKPQEKLLNLKIVAVTKKSATSLMFGPQSVFLSAADGRAVYDFTSSGTAGYGKYLYASVRVRDGTNESKLLAAKSALEADGFYILSSKEIQKSITQIVDVLQIMVGVFGLITVIASVFGIVNTQYISVLERTKEIGLMKALGMKNRDVRHLFMVEAGWIGLIGGTLGAIGAIVASFAINPLIAKKLSLGNDLMIFKPLQVVLLIASLAIVAIFAGYLPARKAARLDPIEALRTE